MQVFSYAGVFSQLCALLLQVCALPLQVFLLTGVFFTTCRCSLTAVCFTITLEAVEKFAGIGENRPEVRLSLDLKPETDMSLP